MNVRPSGHLGWRTAGDSVDNVGIGPTIMRGRASIDRIERERAAWRMSSGAVLALFIAPFLVQAAFLALVAVDGGPLDT